MISIGWLCSELGLDGHGTFGDLIQRATAFVEAQTGRYFGEPEDETYWLTGVGSRNLWLPEPPTVSDSVDSGPEIVIERAHPGADGEELEVDVHFAVRGGKDAKLVRLDGKFWRVGYEYEVTYTRGYEVDEGPADVRQLVISLCSLRINERGSEGIRSETIGADYSYTRFASHDLAMIPGADATIEAWRRVVYA